MYAFTYARPGSVADAATLLAGADARALAGGQTMIPTLKQRLAKPATLVDLSALARTHDLSVKYAAAYFLKVLQGEARADAFLTGPEFQKDAQTGAVSQQSK